MKNQLENIASKVEELVKICDQLNTENKALRKKESEWANERRQLLIKNETARNKVEAMINRLKTMETNS